MHTGPFAFEANAAASVGYLALLISLFFCIVRWHLPRWVWLFVFWAAFMWTYFGLIAISAGPAPVFQREDMAMSIRSTLIFANVFLYLGLGFLVWTLVRKGRVTTSATFRLALLAGVISKAMTRTATHYLKHGDGSVLTASEREYQVLRLATAGLNIDDIGRLLGIHRSTVNTYTSRWLQRTGAHNKAMLASWALLTGLVTPADVWEIWERHAPLLAAWKQDDGADR